jgi:hypothetical protein
MEGDEECSSMQDFIINVANKVVATIIGHYLIVLFEKLHKNNRQGQ